MKKRKLRHSLTANIIIGVVLIILLMQAGSGLIGLWEFRSEIVKQYEENAITLARLAGDVIDTDRLDDYLETHVKTEGYLNRQHTLQKLCNNAPGCLIIYVAKVDVEKGTRTYVYNIVSNTSGYTPYPIGTIEKSEDNILEQYVQILDGEIDYGFTYGEGDVTGDAFTTAQVPLRDVNGNIVAICSVVESVKSVQSMVDQFVRKLTWLGLAAASMFAIGWSLLMQHQVISPLRRIADEAGRFSVTGTLPETKLAPVIKQKNEVGELADSVDQMEEAIVSYVNELLKITGEKNRIQAELDVAAKIQAAALPVLTEEFPGRPELDVFAIMDPAKEVGGDFYDVFFIDEDHLALVIADVSGKGVPAALFMMISKTLIKSSCVGKTDPGIILTEVNKLLCEHNQNDMFVTVWLGILELSTGIVKASSAGHEYPVKTGEDGQMELVKDRHGLVLGGMEMAKYRMYEWQLRPGDVLFVYTDGVPEAINDKVEQYGTDRMVEALRRCESHNPEELVTAVLADLSGFVGNEEQFDDTTMLCICYNGPQKG